MDRVLVTGGAGYIGAHTCRALHMSGFDPLVIDNLSTGHADFVKWGQLFVGDLRDQDVLNQVFQSFNPVAVIHFAASASVSESVENPLSYYSNNVTSTISLIDAMVRNGVKRLVFSSSCATYGVPQTEFISEDHAQVPINPYGFTKLVCERLINDLSQNGELQTVCLRYFNAAGASHDSEIGEWHTDETHLIPRLICNALEGKKSIIYGSDYPTPDGTAIRDYVHVDDLARGHVSALKYLLEGNPSEAVNLGSGFGSSILDVINVAVKNGINVNFEYGPRRVGDPPRLVASREKAAELFNWEPSKDLENIVVSALNWHRNGSTGTNRLSHLGPRLINEIHR